VQIALDIKYILMEAALIVVLLLHFLMDIHASNALFFKFGMEQIVSIDVMGDKFITKLQEHVRALLILNGMVIVVCRVTEENSGIHNLKIVNVHWVKIGMVKHAFIVIQAKYSTLIQNNAYVLQDTFGVQLHVF
jgi:hypothetical protein